MKEFVIKGGSPLHGEIPIGGAKNAALGLLAASIMADEDVYVRNIPDVSDVNTLLEAISDTGARVKRLNRHEVMLNGSTIRSYVVNNSYIRKMRAGYVFRTRKVRYGPCHAQHPVIPPRAEFHIVECLLHEFFLFVS